MKNIFNSKLRKSDSHQRKVADGPGAGINMTVQTTVSADVLFLPESITLDNVNTAVEEVSIDSYDFSFAAADTPDAFAEVSIVDVPTKWLYSLKLPDAFDDMWDDIQEEFPDASSDMTFGEFVTQHEVKAFAELLSSTTVSINPGGYTQRAELPVGATLEVASGGYNAPQDNWEGGQTLDLTIDGKVFESGWSSIINVLSFYQISVTETLSDLFQVVWKSDDPDYDLIYEEFGLS